MEDMIPYLEQIAGPGCRVIFLVHYSDEGFDWFESKSPVSLIKERKLVVEKNTFALEALRERDVTVALDIYAGPVRKVVRQYTDSGDIDLVMIAARSSSWLARFFQKCLLNFSWQGKSPSVLLLRPDISEGEQ